MYKFLVALFFGLGLYLFWCIFEVLDAMPELAPEDAERYGELMSENSGWFGWNGTPEALDEIMELHKTIVAQGPFIMKAYGLAALGFLSFFVSLSAFQKDRDENNN